MIPHGVDIYIGLDPIDLRWSFDRLLGITQERMGIDARSQAIFVFFGKRKTALKLFFFDGSGLCIFYKRLDKGVFRLPLSIDEQAKTAVINDRALYALLEGIEIEKLKKRRRVSKKIILH